MLSFEFSKFDVFLFWDLVVRFIIWVSILLVFFFSGFNFISLVFVFISLELQLFFKIEVVLSCLFSTLGKISKPSSCSVISLFFNITSHFFNLVWLSFLHVCNFISLFFTPVWHTFLCLYYTFVTLFHSFLLQFDEHFFFCLQRE